MPPVLIVGCGDVGRRLARRLQQAGHAVTGVVSSAASAHALRERGIEPRLFDLDQALAADRRPDAGQIYWLAPPPRQGAGDPRLRRWLETLRARTRKLVYISTSGVYGDCQGRWIDEDQTPRPLTDRGRRRLDAEQALAHLAAGSGTQYCVLRVPGIYGPGRLPVARLRQGLPVVRDDPDPARRRWTNRVHAEDLADIAMAAMARGRHGAVYHACDGQPTTMSDYFGRCARLLGLPPPPEISMEQARNTLSPALLSFLEESRRLSNERMSRELGVQLRYPDLDSGLPACLEDGDP